jgi:NTP pyrophosphatase (non-canonical NTP hydrolase)
MNIKEFQELSRRTMPDVHDSASLRMALANYSMGLAGETGEVVDILKKCVFHRHPMTTNKLTELKKELGDVMHYLVGLATLYDIDMEQVLEMNIAKLKKRYPEGFSTERSVNRVD